MIKSSGRKHTTPRGLGTAGSAPAWHAGGQEFESPRLHSRSGLHPRPANFNVSFPEVRVDRGPFHIVPECLLEISQGHADVLCRKGDICLNLCNKHAKRPLKACSSVAIRQQLLQQNCLNRCRSSLGIRAPSSSARFMSSSSSRSASGHSIKPVGKNTNDFARGLLNTKPLDFRTIQMHASCNRANSDRPDLFSLSRNSCSCRVPSRPQLKRLACRFVLKSEAIDAISKACNRFRFHYQE